MCKPRRLYVKCRWVVGVCEKGKKKNTGEKEEGGREEDMVMVRHHKTPPLPVVLFSTTPNHPFDHPSLHAHTRHWTSPQPHQLEVYWTPLQQRWNGCCTPKCSSCLLPMPLNHAHSSPSCSPPSAAPNPPCAMQQPPPCVTWRSGTRMRCSQNTSNGHSWLPWMWRRREQPCNRFKQPCTPCCMRGGPGNPSCGFPHWQRWQPRCL